ncbi:MAG: AarF/ABC1/UbiB kinase family protein [Nitrospinae bacterium]|nr:AarF/ABC1/UbiB kinase family protein [Nitrospinota bacterium]MBF0633780.1 AarF/ABC1/UbiB kinase family protein [Nitrospinota bacterium]
MTLKGFRHATRHIARYREVFSVLARYGFSDWVNRVEFDFAREILERKAPHELLSLSTQQRVRLALMDLGPTFIKLGQFLSVRPDIIGVSLSEELKLLQSRVKGDPPEVARGIVETDLKSKIEDVFEEFEPFPVASASIGQVHRATLKTGEKVAVKVRREGIEQVVATDMEILADIATIVERYVEESRYYRPCETVSQFTRVITREMDFLREARNIINLGSDLDGQSPARIPKVYEQLTTSRVLVMEWFDGKQLNQLTDEDRQTLDLASVAEKVARLYLEMIFVSGFYHADPHPGNIMIMADGKLGLLDFGMTGRLSARVREYIEDLIPVIVTGDSDRLARIIIKIGSLPATLDQASLGADISEFISYYGAIPIARINLSEALNEAVSIIHRHHIILPSEVIVLLKTLMTLEGSNRALSPDFSLISLLAPYQKNFASSMLSPGKTLKRVGRLSDSLRDFMETAPPAMADILERFRKETMEIHMEHRGLEHSANRLVFGILTAAIFMGSSMVLSAGLPPKILGLSALGLFGYLISLVMGIRILWAIWISGRLE